MRVLVTERDPLVRQWLGLQAAEQGVEMIFAVSGGEALEVMENEAPDCVVLDALSSVGEETLLWSKLREAAETQQIPVLLYSSSERWQRVAELAGAELDGFIARPFTPVALLDAAQRASERRRPAQA